MQHISQDFFLEKTCYSMPKNKKPYFPQDSPLTGCLWALSTAKFFKKKKKTLPSNISEGTVNWTVLVWNKADILSHSRSSNLLLFSSRLLGRLASRSASVFGPSAKHFPNVSDLFFISEPL